MKSSRSRQRPLAAMAAILAFSIGGAFAQEAPATAPSPAGLSLDLNTANDVDGGCRLAFVAYNGTPTALDTVSYEVVVFDGSQRISQFVILEFGALPPQKTKVVRFDIANSKCADISRLVINSASRCEAGGAAVPLCLDAVKPTSRTSIVLGL